MGAMTLSDDWEGSRACERRLWRSSSDNFVSFGKVILKQPSKARISDLVKSITEIRVKTVRSLFPTQEATKQNWIVILHRGINPIYTSPSTGHHELL